uniref:Uncharacterized protein n=1 Tax=Arundo donax TaxID=35708 RepID=A0A0A9AWU9_ARUDO
MANHCRLTFCN